MSKIISIKLTRVSSNAGPFNIYDQFGNLIAENISKDSLLEGMHFTVDDNVVMVRVSSVGDCTYEKWVRLADITKYDFYTTPVEQIDTGCVWVHLKNPEIYNTFYGSIEPYVIEHPMNSINTEIFQSFTDYTKAYKYTQDVYGVSNEPSKVEVDDIYFTNAIIYNGQQCSGVLNLIPKPKNNLKAYNLYPIYRNNGRDILYVKSDNSYHFNGFYDIVKDKTQFLFVRNCDPLSVDKTIHQENMEYTNRAFRKAPIRGKETRIRLTLSDRDDVHLVSQFTLNTSQISYK